MIIIRKIGVIGRTYRHLNRYRQILTIFFKYGFGDLVDQLRIEQYIDVGLQMISRKKREKVEKLSRPERLRMIFEELGPTFIKLGQVLSTRPDLVPVNFIEELSKLQDEVPPFPFARVREIIDAEFGMRHENIFEFVDEQPLASASIAQVHKGRLRSGDDVAVKVQRPGIQKIIEVDLEIMLHLATLMERHIQDADLHQPVKIVEEFAATLEKELDFSFEAASMERMARFFMNDATVYIPKVYREASTQRILTMELVEGIKVSETGLLKAEGLDCKKITVRGADFILKQIFEGGFFHADPHPGNIFVLENNVICPVDFGMVGRVDRRMRDLFIDLIESVVEQEPSRTTRILLELTEWDKQPVLGRLESDVESFTSRFFYTSLKNIDMGQLLQQLLIMVSRHRLRIPPDIFLMMKALATVEGIGLRLDPDFDMVAHAKPFVKRVKLERFSPGRIAGDMARFTEDSLLFARRFPRELLEISKQIKEERVGIRFEMKRFESLLDVHAQAGRHIALAIIIAGLIVGSSMLFAAQVRPIAFGVSLIGLIGYVAAFAMSIWMFIRKF